MTIAVDLESPIGRSVEATFAELTAIGRWPEWLLVSGITRVVPADSGPLRVGATFDVEARVAGRATRLSGTVTALAAAERLAVRAKSSDGVSLEIEARLRAVGPATVLGWSVRIGLPLRFRWAESTIAPEVRRAMTVDLATLRRRMESVASG